MRIGKFEKWLLINAYRKTVLREDLGILPDHYRLDKSGDFYFTYLFKSEAIKGYFDPPESEKNAWCDVHLIFKDTPQYRAALVQYRQATLRLFEKDLVKIYSNPYSDEWKDAIVLTERGAQEAKRRSP